MTGTAQLELIGLECVMVLDHPMVRATFAVSENNAMWVSPDGSRSGDSNLALNFTEEEAEKLRLHSKYKLELFDG